MSVIEALISMGVSEEKAKSFLEYHRSNPAIWKEFERYALLLVKRSKRFGAMAIINRIRWEVEVERGDDFKVNNNYAPYYARVFGIKYPQHKDFFETRDIHGVTEKCER